ncbi:hypothetical protein BDB00DRAFT_806819 [Zychaea mexicana]|uniref:uncharacterized protein n=1 Tax=Zychaea mexicana TaxID=64656 RepID=UPI0022FEC35C|nr:uncharacterized protein BDB00DRAFT_806819 [Zychaea mexicana]KAI9497111.1 hypothetical protein BDB00DRAFT_806819 [Zychaea mexicana]
MATPDEKKTTVKRGFTKRAGRKVRHFLQRARGKKDNHHATGTAGSGDDDDEDVVDDDAHNMKNTSSTSNLSQSSLTTTETDEDEFHDALMKPSATSSTKDSKFSDFQSSSIGTSTSSSHQHHARPEKTADRSIIAPHDGYRSRKTSTTSNLDHYDRQRASFDRTRAASIEQRQRAVSSPKPTTPPSGVFANKQSSSIVVVPAAAPGPSPPISPTSPSSVPLSASDYSLTTRSVEELSVASFSLRREDHKEAPPPLVVVPSTSSSPPPSSRDSREVAQERNNSNNKERSKEKEAETNKEEQKQQQQQQHKRQEEDKEENILIVDENSYVLPTKASSNAIVVAAAAAASSSSSASCTNNVDEEVVGEQEVSKRVAYFDKKHRGKITMLDTFTSLRELGYHWMFAIPATLIMHLRLSPLTTLPHHPRSVRDWFSLPIYTERVAQALAHYHNNTLLIQRREQVSKWVDLYGRSKNSMRGLTFWDGFRALRGAEKTTLRWWQLRLWLAHRLQWILTYSILHDPQTRMVTQPALEYLCPTCPP